MKVSFDFDSTLSRHEVQQFAKELVQQGHEVWIVTSRISNEQSKIEYSDNYTLDRVYKSNKKLFRIADNVGIPRSNIQFMNFQMKSEFIKDKGFVFHLDDDADELMDIIATKDPCKSINADHFDWERDCREVLNKNQP
jgi:hydroxymethylpyrimidine pyrophosphatase-like HAD family hydrolase